MDQRCHVVDEVNVPSPVDIRDMTTSRLGGVDRVRGAQDRIPACAARNHLLRAGKERRGLCVSTRNIRFMRRHVQRQVLEAGGRELFEFVAAVERLDRPHRART